MNNRSRLNGLKKFNDKKSEKGINFHYKIMECQKWVNSEITMVKYQNGRMPRGYSIYNKIHLLWSNNIFALLCCKDNWKYYWSWVLGFNPFTLRDMIARHGYLFTQHRFLFDKGTSLLIACILSFEKNSFIYMLYKHHPLSIFLLEYLFEELWLPRK